MKVLENLVNELALFGDIIKFPPSLLFKNVFKFFKTQKYFILNSNISYITEI